jgi:protein-tyrosine phosphatase
VPTPRAERDGTRLVPLEGTLNFRDLGGYPATGGVTRWGAVYRSDRLSELTDADVAHLATIGLRTVCDFRYDREVEEDPSRLPDGARVVRLAVGAAPGDNPRSLEDMIRAREIAQVTTASMAEGYVAMLERQAALFGDLIRLVAQDHHHAVVIHCTAGKDRTGLGAALLLGAVGVAEDVIVEDYALTDQYRSVHRLAEIGPKIAAQGLDLEDLKVLFTAPAETMALTLGHITDRWGGIEGYLTGPAGVTTADLGALRAAWVD